MIQQLKTKQVAVGFLGASTVLAFSLALYSMPGVGRGLWSQSEMPSVVMHLAAALSCLGLYVLSLS